MIKSSINHGFKRDCSAMHVPAHEVPPPLPPAARQVSEEIVRTMATLRESSSWVSLSISVPGMSRNDLQVTLYHGVIKVEGCRRIFNDNDGENDVRCVKKQRIKRRFGVKTHQIDMHKFYAYLSNDVLYLRAPKMPVVSNDSSNALTRQPPLLTQPILLPISTDNLHVITADSDEESLDT